jgi:hypothetical protein
MTTVRRSSRLAAKEVLKAPPTRSVHKEVLKAPPTPSERKEVLKTLPTRSVHKEVLKAVSTLSDRKEFQSKEEPKVKNIELEEPMKVTVRKPVPKLVDYDSDDSQRTISDIVTLPAKPILVKTETVKPQIIKDILEEKTETVNKPVDFTFYMTDNKPSASKSVSTSDLKGKSVSTSDLKGKSVSTSDLKGKSVSTSDIKGKECLICKQTTFINKFKDYLNIIENSIGNFKISLIVELFEFIEKNFDYINTKEFDSNKRFVLVIHTKAVSLQEELDYKIKCTNPQYTNDIAMFNNAKKLLQRIHTKCHLYGMDQFVTADPIYKKFLDTFIDQYVQL